MKASAQCTVSLQTAAVSLAVPPLKCEQAIFDLSQMSLRLIGHLINIFSTAPRAAPTMADEDVHNSTM
jgi:hypothetical protein